MAEYINRVDLVLKLDWDNDLGKWTLREEDLDDITTITEAAFVGRGEWSNPRWWIEHYEGWVADCPYCGRVNPLPSNYCNGCGARLEANLPE